MEIYTNAKVSPVGKVNKEDLQRIVIATLIFLAAPILLYAAQLQGTLTQNHVLFFSDLVPNLMTIGAIEGWFIGIIINFFLKLSDGKK